jgi:O-antigen/teichoic acid export membrane protein
MKLTDFFKNLLSVYSANFISGILGVAAVPLVVAALGKEQYGIYSIYTILASYVAIVDCGVTKHFVRLIASNRNPENQKECLQKALGWYLLLAIILISTLPLTILFVCRFLFPVSNVYQNQLMLIVILVVVEFCITIPTMISQTLTVSNEKFTRLSKFNVITGCYRYGFMIFAALMFKKPSIVVAFMAGRRLVDIYVAKKIIQWPSRDVWRPRIKFGEFKTILARSSILSLAQFLQTTIVAIGSILVNREFGVYVLGNYRAAFDLGGKIWFLSNGIGMLIYPKFSNILADESNRKMIAEKIYGLLKLSWTFYLLIGLLGILSAKYILPIMKLNSDQIVIFFVILFVGICINAHSNVAYEFMLADGRYETVAKLSIVSLGILWAAFYFLKSAVGPYCIAWAWVLSQSVYALSSDELMMTIKFNKADSIKGRSFLLKLGMLIVTIACLIAEIYYNGVASLMLTATLIMVGILYLLKMLPIRQFMNRA